jgi:hypothetical protein
MKLNDEIINRYIDGELSPEESEEVKKLLLESPGLYNHYKVLSSLHNKLKRISSVNVSPDFTAVMMEKINSLKVRKKDSLFILSISSVFVILSILVTAFVAWQLITTGAPAGEFSIYDEVSKTTGFFLDLLNNFRNSKGFSILGTIFSFGILISAYFFFEHQRMLKRQ